MSRNLLHKDKLEEFKAWLTANGIDHRPGNGDYQVLQVRSKNKKNWFPIYRRDNMLEHLTVIRYLEPLVIKFIAERHENDKP